MTSILGVSIGTRNVGLAVIRLRALTDYRIRTFPGKWTATKCRRILEIVETLVVMNGITDITVKVPDVHHTSPGTLELMQEILELAKRHSVRLHRSTTAEIKQYFTAEKRSSKKVIVDALIKKYPVLKDRWHGTKHAQAYNAKLFEAIACAELALRAGH